MRSLLQFSSVAPSCLTLWLHGLQHTRLPCPSPTSGVYSNSCPLSQWCHPTISSSVIPSPPAFNLSQHEGFFKWVSSSHQVTKVLEFQLQHQSFQWILSPTLNTSPMQQVIYFLFLWICLFWTFYINGIVQYVDFCDGHLTHSAFKVHLFCSMYLYFIPVYSMVWLYYKPTHQFMDVGVNFSLLSWGHSYGCVLMASPTQWTWVWANSERQWRTGEPGVLQPMGSQRVRHHLPTEPQQQLITHCDF